MNCFTQNILFILIASAFLSACSFSKFISDSLALGYNSSYTNCSSNFKQYEKEGSMVLLVENQSKTKKVDELPPLILGFSPLIFEFYQSRFIQAELSNTIQFLLDNKQFPVVLHDDADQLGSEIYNIKSSYRRAKNIEKILIEAGISQNQISIVAHGKFFPKVPAINFNNDPSKAEAISYYSPNRKVEISFDLNSLIAQSN